MRYRSLGKTGLQVSEIGLGGEWLERHSAEEVKAVVDYCAEKGINILDCWMSEPNVRAFFGAAQPFPRSVGTLDRCVNLLCGVLAGDQTRSRPGRPTIPPAAMASRRSAA